MTYTIHIICRYIGVEKKRNKTNEKLSKVGKLIKYYVSEKSYVSPIESAKMCPKCQRFY